SLKTADFEQAKVALATLAATAPQIKNQGVAPSSREVLTLAVLKAYIDDRGSAIASEDAATIAVKHFTSYLDQAGQIGAPVSYWTPSRQIECARWLNETHKHSAGYIARMF